MDMVEQERKELMDKRVQVLKKAILAGAEAILAINPADVAVIEKTSDSDVVTTADLNSEEAIVRIIQEAFPEDVIISEEMSEEIQVQLSPENLPNFTGWIIDPLDGTNSFRYKGSYSGVSIGFIESGKPAIGAICNPFTSELFFAEEDKGATLNGNPIHVSQTQDFKKSTRVVTSNPYEDEKMRENLKRILKLDPMPWIEVRGSAVLIMTDVAAGRFDLYEHNGLKPFDNPAGFLIVKEAGGKVVGLKGEEISFLSPEVVMGNPVLVDKFIQINA